MDHCFVSVEVQSVPSGLNVLGNVAEVLDLWLQTPVPFVLLQELMLVEKSGQFVSLNSHLLVQLHIP